MTERKIKQHPEADFSKDSLVLQEAKRSVVFTEKLMGPYFQALEGCRGVPQMDRHHPEGDVFNHSLQVLRWAFRESIDTDLILAAMLHDVGKAIETRGHEEKAIEMLGDHLSAKTKWLIEQHMRIWDMVLGEMRRQGKVRYLIEHPFLPDFILLARWDKMGRDPRQMVYYSRSNIIERLNRCVQKRYLTKNKEELDG